MRRSSVCSSADTPVVGHSVNAFPAKTMSTNARSMIATISEFMLRLCCRAASEIVRRMPFGSRTTNFSVAVLESPSSRILLSRAELAAA